MDNPHKATISSVTWKDVREEVLAVNPELATIIDALNPGKEYVLYKAKYPFGAKIAQTGSLNLPTGSENLANNIKRRKMPTVLMLKKTTEIFFELPNRLISGHVLHPGKFLWLWEQFDEHIHNNMAWSWNIGWTWSLASGARSLYSVPKITDVHEHKQLQKKYGISSHVPRDYLDQWKIFVEIANSPNFEEDWYSELLFFTDIWFEMANKDPAWKSLYDYLFKISWEDSAYWRYKSSFELAWECFIDDVIDRNIRPNIYLANIVKQLVLTGMGIGSCLTVANDDLSAPIKALQRVYLEDYKMRTYYPIFMRPHIFSPNDNFPCYYPLQFPNLLETMPVPRTVPSVLSAIPDIKYLLNEFRNKMTAELEANNSVIDTFCRNVECEYFHYQPEKWNDIRSTVELPEDDSRFLDYPKIKGEKEFPSSSNLISGCVRFRNKKQNTKC